MTDETSTGFERFKIDSVPDVDGRKGAEPKLPLHTMLIGECFFVPGANIRRICSMIAYANRNRQGCIRKKYTARTMEHKGIKGVGIIRVAHPVFDAPENLHQFPNDPLAGKHI